MDKWDRKTNFNCDSCMFFVPKRTAVGIGEIIELSQGRCRRNAPTMKGYPVVYDSDWCGEHKIGSNPVRNGKEEPTLAESAEKMSIAMTDHQKHLEMEKALKAEEDNPPWLTEDQKIAEATEERVRKEINKEKIIKLSPKFYSEYTIQELADAMMQADIRTKDERAGKFASELWNKPIEEKCEHEWIDADNEVVSGAEMCRTCHKIRSKIGKGIRIKPTGTEFQIGMDPEKKEKIKRDIRQQCEFLKIVAGIGDPTEREKDTKLYTEEIKRLLEKL